MIELTQRSSLFTPIRLGVIGALGVLTLLINLATGTVVVLATGVIAAGGVVMATFQPMMMVLSRLILPRFGSATLVGTVYGVLALGVPILGPPGFLPKLVITLAAGLATDGIFQLFRNQHRRAAVVASIGSAYTTFLIMLAAFTLVLPENIPTIFTKTPMLIGALVAVLPLGALGGYLGWLIFDRIKERELILRLR